MAKILEPKMDSKYIPLFLNVEQTNISALKNEDALLMELIDDCSDGTYNIPNN